MRTSDQDALIAEIERLLRAADGRTVSLTEVADAIGVDDLVEVGALIAVAAWQMGQKLQITVTGLPQ